MTGPATARVRFAAVAGTFYPSQPDRLRGLLDELLGAVVVEPSEVVPEALVVPHAGYVYSGPIAASGYARLRPAIGRIHRVGLFGPAHFVPLAGIAVSGADAWETPVGRVVVDAELRALAVEAGAVLDDRPHGPEHALEVQLPFLLHLLGGDVRVVPLAVGRTEPSGVAATMGALWSAIDLLVVSTDLSHYLDRDIARARDRRTADAVLARDARAIGPDDACGAFALRGLVELARRRDLPVRLLDLRSSADTAGDPGRVVGYAAFAVGGR